MKYSLEFKMECVQKYMKGEYIPTPGKSHNQRLSFLSHVRAWTKKYNDLGIDGLKHSNTNIEWTQEKRFELVAKVLAGNSIKSVAKSAHINDGQLYQWVKRYKEKGMDGLQLRKGRKPKMPRRTKKDSTKLTKSEKEELILLREKAKVIKELLLIHKDYNLSKLLKIAALPKSTYYFEINKKDIDAIKNNKICDLIKNIFFENKERYGFRRIEAELKNKGYIVNHKKIIRLMKKMNLKAKIRKQKYHSYIGEEGHIADNIINRDFTSIKPNEKWTTDVSQFNCPFGKVYLSPILDMGAGDIVAWDLSLSPNLEQIKHMLDEAFTKYPNLEGLVFHSDQGWQYQHNYYQERLKGMGIIQSMSRKGNCIDNCIMESFFGTLKNEMFYGHESEFKTFDEFKEAIGNYINYYNNKRIKKKTKWMPPSLYRETSMMSL